MVNSGDYIGSYRVLSQLSSDSISHVYLAENAYARGNAIAIRIWPDVHFTTPQARDAFLQEAQNLARLRHPNILPVIDFGIENTTPYVVTPHNAVSNNTLRDSIRSQARQPFPEEAALNILSQVGQALFYAHQQYILHRQLTPEQIGFNEKGEAILTNFGLASILDALNTTPVTRFGMITSDPYLAPEQLESAAKSKLGDQYALGAIVYELFTGAQSSYALNPPRHIHPALSPAIEQVILKALSPQPTQRYPSVDAFLQALSAASSARALTLGPAWAYTPPEGYSPVFAADTTQRAEPVMLSVTDAPPPPVFGSGVSFSAPTISGGSGGNASTPPPLRKRSKQRPIMVPLALVLLVFISFPFLVPYLLSILPAAVATVNVTPKSQHLSDILNVYAVTGEPDVSQHQVAVRVLTFTSQSLSRTVNATGQGHQVATAATGTLIISNAGKNAAVAANQTLSGTNGVQITTDTSFSITVGGTATVTAHAKNPGSAGNIPAYDINGTYQVIDSTNQQFITTVYIQNTSPFTGGQDAFDYTFVQQSNIDNVANPMIVQLTPTARAGAKQQLHANEQLVNGDVQCTPNINPDHKANEHATTVTVTVAVTCKGEAYVPQALQTTAMDALKGEATTKLGANYMLVGDEVAGTPSQVGTAASNGTATFAVKVDGIWVYQLSSVQQQRLAQLIAGKRQADSIALLLQQEGIQNANIKTSGLGNALPTWLQSITVIVLPVQGLHAATT